MGGGGMLGPEDRVKWMADEQRPSRRGILKGAALLGLSACAAKPPEEPEAPDPHVPVPHGGKTHNVVVIMVDDPILVCKVLNTIFVIIDR